jgi:2-haloalkanoic acid dehalogenase type II
MDGMARYAAVAFDLLTSLVDSWTLWNRAAGNPEIGRRWRSKYLELTYGAGTYRSYEDVVAESARLSGVPPAAAQEVVLGWDDLSPWPEARAVLGALVSRGLPLAVVTNCSEWLARRAAARVGAEFSVIVSAERAGWYKPRPEPYQLMLRQLGLGAGRVLYVAGSPSDVGGAGAVGLDVFWHNRIGLPPLKPEPTRLIGTAASLEPILPLVGDPRAA